MALPNLKTFVTRERFRKTAAVIIFHGEEGCAQRLKDRIKNIYNKDWDFDHIQVIFPQAPEIPNTVEEGKLQSVWFDRKAYTKSALEFRESRERSCSLVRQMVDNLFYAGVKRNRIVLGGFDIGAQLAMHVGYRFFPDVAGVFGISTYLHPTSYVFQHMEWIKRTQGQTQFPPLFLCHQREDRQTPIKWAAMTAECFMDFGVDCELQVYYDKPERAKTLSVYEMDNLREWILQVLPENYEDK